MWHQSFIPVIKWRWGQASEFEMGAANSPNSNGQKTMNVFANIINNIIYTDVPSGHMWTSG